MSDKEGVLQMQSSGHWAICRPGRDPFEITTGDVFRVEVNRKLKPTRMEYAHGEEKGGGAYYSIDGFRLADDLRAAIGAED